MTAPAQPTFELPPGCDSSSTWQYDPMHMPRPLPALSQEMLRALNTYAFGLETAFVHGFSFAKDFAPPPPTAEILEKGVVKIWEEEFVPRIEAFCREIQTRDYDSLTTQTLADELRALFRRAGQIFEMTMTVVFPFMGPTLHLVEVSEELLGPEGPLLVASVLQGYANETSAAGSGLANLTALASSLPDVADALRRGNAADLETVPGGKQFLEALGEYLSEYGWRVDDWSLMQSPTWVEDPSTPLRMIAAFLGDQGQSPQALIDRAATMREAAREKINARLSGEALAQLSALIDVARPHVSMSEGRARWQLTIVGSLRAHIGALGRRLVASGVVSESDDVFFLTSDELVALAANPSPAQSLVLNRKQELARSAQMQPPTFLGATPDAQAMPPEVASVFRRFFGLGVEPSTDSKVIRGNSGAPGKARGRARIITELADSDRLEPGDVLVCTLTAPPWTPLFAIAAAVVTDTGGVLSHSAICAREFAIPCVVGTQVGTRLIPDGAMITVDGDSGLVRLE